MAFSFGQTGPQIQKGPDLEDIQTEELGFLSIAGESKLRLLPTPWPSNNLPPPTSSLLSIASQRGIIAAAGPDAVVIAATDSVRSGFQVPKTGDGDLRQYQPQVKISMDMRISQVTFTADESLLVLSAEDGGGLAVYDVQSLMSGNTQTTFQLPTNSLSLRALLPCPDPERAELLATVTIDGKLMMVNLKDQNFVNGSNGPVLREGVSCISWSTKGKQLVAGMGDGTALQMTPDGKITAEIPRPPGLDGNYHVSSLSWLANNVFLTIHTPPATEPESNPLSVFHIVTRQPPSSFEFRMIPDPAEPFGLNRSPPHHFLARLKDFPPNLQDLIIVASTASTDIGLFSKSKIPLTADKPAEKIRDVFTMTGMSDDSRRAQLPATEDMMDTSPIGLALDLSSRDTIMKPLPMEEIDQSASPLPGVMVLNNEGILSYWWIIYSDSIRNGTAYPGLIAGQVSQMSPSRQQTTSFGNFTQNSSQSPLQAAASSASPLGTSTFGSALPTSAGMSAFGTTSSLKSSASPWGTSPSSTNPSSVNAFSAPAFGAPTPMANQGVAFGSSGLPGNRVSPWASGGTRPSASVFGQPSGPTTSATPFGSNVSNSSPFGGNTANFAGSGGGGFASFASSGGFAAASKPSGGSIFGAKSEENKPFSSPSIPLNPAVKSVFGVADLAENKTQGLFGGAGFTLGSTFKPDGSAKDDGPKPKVDVGGFFGSGFGNVLKDAGNSATSMAIASQDSQMDMEEPIADQGSNALTISQPTSVPVQHGQNVAAFGTSAPANSSTMAVASSQPAPDASKTAEVPATMTSVFGKPKTSVSSPFGASLGESKLSPSSLFTNSTTTQAASSFLSAKLPAVSGERALPFNNTTNITNEPSAKSEVIDIKQEPLSDDESNAKILEIPEAPLPPDPTSKSAYNLGDSSISSTEPETTPAVPTETSKVPLPALPQEASSSPESQSPTDLVEGPPDDDGGWVDDDDESESLNSSRDRDDDGNEEYEEDSAGDVAKSPSPEPEIDSAPPAITPQNLFKGLTAKSGGDSFFSNGSTPASKISRPLFGEIQNNMAPLLPMPTNYSPRSPSPVRKSIPEKLRPGPSRSVGAPGVASQLLVPATILPQPIPSVNRSSSHQEQHSKEHLDTRRSALEDAEDAQALIDDEDRSVQEYLEREIVPTKTLGQFIARQEYITRKDKNKDSIPSQVEAVYRDINSMIDTLGTNACALKGFIAGHSGLNDEGSISRENLDGEDVDDWALGDIRLLSMLVEGNLTDDLTQGRVRDALGKITACVELKKETGRLRGKGEEIRNMIISQTDPDIAGVIRAKPLSAEQIVQQQILRKDLTKFQKLLHETEESLTMLRAQLVSQGGRNGAVNGGPTVEAVMRTIIKMTSMAEKRSGDVDVLENQMRRLRFSTISREGSPLTSPRSSVRTAAGGSTYGLFYTPESVKESRHGLRDSLLMSSPTQSFRGTPPRRKMSGLTSDDRLRIKRTSEKRLATIQKLKTALSSSAARVYGYDP